MIDSTAYLNSLFSFALKNTATLEDAEDLTQEIILKLLQVSGDDIRNRERYVWQTARNSLSNYYRKKSRLVNSISSNEWNDELPGTIPGPEEQYEQKERIREIRQRITYLSGLQRKIVIQYYFDELPIPRIAQSNGIPPGTVKWHLYEARNQLKEERVKIRDKELDYNPVDFRIYGTTGAVGDMGGTEDILRTALSRNIIFACYREGKTVNELGDCLSVSPVYIESEVDFLLEYDFLNRLPGNRYSANVLIDSWDSRIQEATDNFYKKSAELLSIPLYEKIINASYQDHPDLHIPDGDQNFMMWSLFPYIIAESLPPEEKNIAFREAATLRRDGGEYISHVILDCPEDMDHPLYDEFQHWQGPLWNSRDGLLLWQVNHRTGRKKAGIKSYSRQVMAALSRLKDYLTEADQPEYEKALLIQQGFLRQSSSGLEIAHVHIKNDSLRQELVSLGTNLKQEMPDILSEEAGTLKSLLLKATPPHLRKIRRYELQHLYSSNGLLLMYCLRELEKSGRLKSPKPEQKEALSSLLIG
ncbi:MAG: sigma-70 family RNA polymerase sigma factor [Spirochaetales bacterium]|nr:sigma-70 family RNA polymerase sigma factor [Spirochaetales bacterium]